MIKSFSSELTRSLFEEDRAEGFLTGIKKVAVRKLDMLHFAASLDDLRVPPGNRLEALKGSRKWQHSIRVNDKYRVCFVFKAGNAYEVEITDYHG
jgi:proteic killer suppression protein